MSQSFQIINVNDQEWMYDKMETQILDQPTMLCIFRMLSYILVLWDQIVSGLVCSAWNVQKMVLAFLFLKSLLIVSSSCSLPRRQSSFKHRVGSHVPTTQHLWLLARSVARRQRSLTCHSHFARMRKAMLPCLSLDPPLAWVSPNTELPDCRRVVSVEPLWH